MSVHGLMFPAWANYERIVYHVDPWAAARAVPPIRSEEKVHVIFSNYYKSLFFLSKL
jgi:hypothetical protein